MQMKSQVHAFKQQHLKNDLQIFVKAPEGLIPKIILACVHGIISK